VQTTAADRADFRDSLRRYLGTRCPEAAVRAVADGERGVDDALWTDLAEQFALSGLGVSEANGGQGLSLADVSVAVEEAARALAPVPLLSSAVATVALTQVGEAAASVLAEIAGGQAVASLGGTTGSIEINAVAGPSGWTLSGVDAAVLDAQIATVLVVPARTADGLALFTVPLTGTGVSVSALDVLDRTRRQFRVTFTDAPAQLMSADFEAGWATTRAALSVLVSAELLAVAERALEIATEYAKNRQQFGRVIGSFQAIKHLLADAFAAVAQMRAGVELTAADAGTVTAEEFVEAAAIVKSYCSDQGPRVVETLVQTLGGIGYTWEHPAHLYLRRAKSAEQLNGDGVAQRAVLAARFGL
jgi:alkylation response protein AidB-like acyl-CoA dehydrogenase